MKNTVFEVRVVEIDPCSEKRSKYPIFDICDPMVVYADTLHSAEQHIARIVAENSGNERQIYCFRLLEKPFGSEFPRYDSLSERVYSPAGEKIDECLYSQIEPFENFTGRSPENIRFKLGDIVEVMQGGTVELNIVVGLPKTPEKIEEALKYNRDDYLKYRELIGLDRWNHLDWGDDSYNVVSGDEGYMKTHSHPRSIHVFEPRFKIPKRLKYKLIRGYLKCSPQ